MTAATVRRCFFDTSVLLYSLDDAEPEKQQIVSQWVSTVWEAGIGAISWQVLNEFYVNGRRKLKKPAPILRFIVEIYSEWQPIGFQLGLLQRAWHWCDHADLNYWDALILASAEALGCRWLLSEDFQEGRRYGTVEVVNPFRTAPAKFFPASNQGATTIARTRLPQQSRPGPLETRRLRSAPPSVPPE